MLEKTSGFKILLGLAATAILVFSGYFFFRSFSSNTLNEDAEVKTNAPSVNEEGVDGEDISRVSVVAEGFEVPWGLVFLPARSAFSTADAGGPDGGMLVTERKGTVRFVSADGKLQEEPVIEITSVKQIGEGGLHGIDLHPNFTSNNNVYLYYTYEGGGENTLNKVVRYAYDGNVFTNEEVIIDNIPGASNHDGGRIKFGPDGFLYITTGDAQDPSQAQDTDSLAGKILRVTDEGDPAPGNPFENEVYSYGHRNPQGIAWDSDGNLWSTEHGPSGLQSGNDEFNKIEAGNNYGWPEIVGSETQEEMVTPALESGSSTTWAPAGLAYLDGKFYFAGLRGSSLYEINFENNEAVLKKYFEDEFGRLREVVTGPDGMLYVTTSNRDGRGIPKAGDDKILRINPNKL